MAGHGGAGRNQRSLRQPGTGRQQCRGLRIHSPGQLVRVIGSVVRHDCWRVLGRLRFEQSRSSLVVLLDVSGWVSVESVRIRGTLQPASTQLAQVVRLGIY